MQCWDVPRATTTGCCIPGSTGVICVSQWHPFLEWARGSLPWPIVNRCAICEWHLWNPDTSSAKGTSLCGNKRDEVLDNSWKELLCCLLRRNTKVRRRTFLPYQRFCGLLGMQWTVLLKSLTSGCPSWETTSSTAQSIFVYFDMFASFMCKEDIISCWAHLPTQMLSLNLLYLF